MSAVFSCFLTTWICSSGNQLGIGLNWKADITLFTVQSLERVNYFIHHQCRLWTPIKIQIQICLTEKSDACWPLKLYVVWCMWWNACLLEDKGNCLFGISGLDSVVCFEIHGNARSPIRIDKNPQFNVSSLQFLRRSAIDCMECWTLTNTNTKNVKLVWALLWRLVSLKLLLLPFWCDFFTKWSLHLKEGHGLGCSVCPLNKY